MEENKNTRFSTIILLIIILVLIGAVVYFVLENNELKDKQLQMESNNQNLQNNTIKQENIVENNILNTTLNQTNANEKEVNNGGNKIYLNNYIGKTIEDAESNDIKIKSINENKIVFELGLFRITTFDNLTAIYDENTNIAQFNTNDTDMGEFWKNIYGTIKFDQDKIILEITESKCEYVQKQRLEFFEKDGKDIVENQEYVGNYKSGDGETAKISLDEKGNLHFTYYENDYILNLYNKGDNGSILAYESKDKLDWFGIYIYPIGVDLKLAETEENQTFKSTDNTKIRVVEQGSSQVFLSEVFYKID